MPQLIVLQTIEFNDWLKEQNEKDRMIIDSRISRIETSAYFGDYKNLDNCLFELRWKNGRRIYFTKLKNQNIYLLIGGLKNGEKEISKKHKQFSIEDFPGIELKNMEGITQYSAIERMQDKALIAEPCGYA